MKKTKWIAAICIMIGLTVSSVYARYATTLSDSFRLDIIAQLYTLTYSAPFAHIGNEGIVHVDKQIANPTFTIGNYSAEHEYLSFLCWEDQTGTHYKAGDTLTLDSFNGILRAVYTLDHNDLLDGSGANNGNYFGDLIVEKETGDLVLTFNGHNNCEIVFFPVKNLVVGGKYTYSFDFFYDAPNGIGFYTPGNKGTLSLGSNTTGVDHVFGYFLVDETTKTSIQKDDSHATLSKYAVVHDAFEGIATKTNFTQTFTANSETMYLGMIMCDIQDFKDVNLHWNNISVTRHDNDADIDLNAANSWHTSSNASQPGSQAISNISVGEDSVSFTVAGVSGVERYAIPITGLTTGQNYTVSFNFSGNPSQLINKNANGEQYQYGYCISPTLNIFTQYQNSGWELFTPSENAQSYSKSFTASGSTAYLILNFSNVSDGIGAVNYELTNLHCKIN